MQDDHTAKLRPLFALVLACGTVAALCLLAELAGVGAGATPAAEIHITYGGLLPSAISTTVDSPIVWVNDTDATVTLAPGPLFRQYLPLLLSASGVAAPGPVDASSGPIRRREASFGAAIEPGQAYTYTFSTPGRYPYHVSAWDPGLLVAGEIRVSEPPPPTPENLTYQIVHRYPHDPAAFTQGLVFDQGCLYEGTGLYGESSLRRVDLETGDVLQKHDLAPGYFGEGITVFDGDRIAQLTWRENTGFIYDRDDFQLLDQFHYGTEGWGLTYDGHRLIMSDGTATLHFLDPHTFQERDTLQVRDPDGPVHRLNELEYVAGHLYANVWLSDRIAVIDPGTGWVTAWADLSGLLTPEQAARANVLNGIAYDAATDRLFVTGKLWPTLFQIRLIPLQPTTGPSDHCRLPTDP